MCDTVFQQQHVLEIIVLPGRLRAGAAGGYVLALHAGFSRVRWCFVSVWPAWLPLVLLCDCACCFGWMITKPSLSSVEKLSGAGGCSACIQVFVVVRRVSL